MILSGKVKKLSRVIFRKSLGDKLNITESGFSLVEILVVIVIAGMIILVLANIFPAVSLIGSGNNERQAKEIAAQKLEDIRTLGYDNLGNGTQEITDSRLNTLRDASATAVISDCAVTICTNGELIKEVEISISWLENGKTKIINLSTLVAKGGLK